MAYVEQTATFTCNARPPVRCAGIESFNHDGVLVARYKRKRLLPDLPWRQVALFLLLGMSLRMVTYSDLGPVAYAERAKSLLNGNMAEQFAATVMKMDAVSERVAFRFRHATRGLRDLIS